MPEWIQDFDIYTFFWGGGEGGYSESYGTSAAYSKLQIEWTVHDDWTAK